jgi:hypothetical protein
MLQRNVASQKDSPRQHFGGVDRKQPSTIMAQRKRAEAPDLIEFGAGLCGAWRLSRAGGVEDVDGLQESPKTAFGERMP